MYKPRSEWLQRCFEFSYEVYLTFVHCLDFSNYTIGKKVCFLYWSTSYYPFQAWIYCPWTQQCCCGSNFLLLVFLPPKKRFVKEWPWVYIIWSFLPSFGPISWHGIYTRPLDKKPFSHKSALENTSNPMLFMLGALH